MSGEPWVRGRMSVPDSSLSPSLQPQPTPSWLVSSLFLLCGSEHCLFQNLGLTFLPGSPLWLLCAGLGHSVQCPNSGHLANC